MVVAKRAIFYKTSSNSRTIVFIEKMMFISPACGGKEPCGHLYFYISLFDGLLEQDDRKIGRSGCFIF